MRNCLKYAQQCQNGIFEKMCQATMVSLFRYVSPRYYVQWKYGESPDTKKRVCSPFTR